MSLIIKPIKTSKSFFFSSTNTSSGASVQGNGIHNNADLNNALNSLSTLQGGNPAILSSNFNDLQSPIQDKQREDLFHWLNVISNFIFVGLMGFSLFMAHKNSLEMSRAVDNAKNTKNSLDLELLDRKDTLTLQGLIKTLTNINDDYTLNSNQKLSVSQYKQLFESEFKAFENADSSLLTRQLYGFTKQDIESLIQDLSTKLIRDYKINTKYWIDGSALSESEILRAYDALRWVKLNDKEINKLGLKQEKITVISELLDGSALELLILADNEIFDRYFAKGKPLPSSYWMMEQIDSENYQVSVNVENVKRLMPYIERIENAKQDYERQKQLEILERCLTNSP